MFYTDCGLITALRNADSATLGQHPLAGPGGSPAKLYDIVSLTIQRVTGKRVRLTEISEPEPANIH